MKIRYQQVPWYCTCKTDIICCNLQLSYNISLVDTLIHIIQGEDMTKEKVIILISFFLMLLAMPGKWVSAQEITQIEDAKVRVEFLYEYKGITLSYSVQRLPYETATGTVMVKGWNSNLSSSTNVVVPSMVTYKDQSYNVTYFGSAFRGSKKITSISLPDTITSIAKEAFYDCTALAEVFLPESLTSIGVSAFENCTSLKKIHLPAGIKDIKYDVFKNCINLETIELPQELTSINQRAFENCKGLQNVYLSSSLTSINRLAFIGTNPIFIVDRDTYAAYYCKINRLNFIYSSEVGKEKVALDGIIATQGEIILSVGLSKSLEVIYYPNNTTEDRSIQWVSSSGTIATVDSNGKVTSLSPGITTVVAKVGAYATRCTIIVKPNAPRGVKATAAGLDRVNVFWSPVKGATSYVIYRAMNASGPYTRLGYAYQPEYEDRKLDGKSTYYYKVCAINNSTYSNFSTIVSAKPDLTTPVFTIIPVSNQSIKLRWAVVPGAEGYIIYRSTSKQGNYKRYKKILTNHVTDLSMIKGKTYYYYVKAYYKVNGKVFYSNNSKILGAVAKTPVKPSYVTLETSRADVYKILGTPNGKYYVGEYQELYYKKAPFWSRDEPAIIYLKQRGDGYYVIGWYNLYPELKVSDGYEADKGTFTLGSTWEEVARSMKTPSTFELKYGGGIRLYPNYNIIFTTNAIKYPDGSTITFDENRKVIGWMNKGELKVKYGSVKATNQVITLGTTVTEVVKVYGTPDSLREGDLNLTEGITYGNTELYFNEYQQLVGWSNKGKINISIGKKETNAPTAKIGDSLDEVIREMGTPDSLRVDNNDLKTIISMTYGSVIYSLDENQRVSNIKR